MKMRLPHLFFCMVAATVLIGSGCATGYDPGLPPLVMATTRTVAPEDLDVVLPEENSEVNARPEEGSQAVVAVYRLQPGDPVIIHLRGIYPRDEQVEDIIDENGNMTIPHVGDIKAIGKSTAELEGDIRRLYIDGGYYKSITVNVVMSARTFFIRGEVKGPGRYPVVGGLTLMQGIAVAGGYTEFASPRNVKLLRGGNAQTINMRSIEKNPETDIRLESGDVIVVERSLL